MNEMQDVLTELVSNLEAVVKMDRLFELGAETIKKSVDALVAKGFSRKEAIQLVSSQGSVLKK